MINRRQMLLGTAAGLAAPLYARAQSNIVELTAQYSIPELFRGLMEDVSTEFSKQNPNIRVNWRAPEQGYE
jgi:ABC-type phosphate transport system substrate-binding protein